MHVRIAPEVQKQIEKMSMSGKADIKKALDIGQRFLTMRFSANDLVATTVLEDSERWDQEVGPLMAMSDWEWDQIVEREGWEWGYGYVDGNKRISGALLSCDTADLIRLEQRDSNYALIYRTRLLGLDPNSAYEEFRDNYPGATSTYELTLILNKKFKVQSLKASNKTTAENVRYRFSEYQEWIGQKNSTEVRRHLEKKYMAIQVVAKTCGSGN